MDVKSRVIVSPEDQHRLELTLQEFDLRTHPLTKHWSDRFSSGNWRAIVAYFNYGLRTSLEMELIGRAYIGEAVRRGLSEESAAREFLSSVNFHDNFGQSRNVGRMLINVDGEPVGYDNEFQQAYFAAVHTLPYAEHDVIDENLWQLRDAALTFMFGDSAK